MYQQRKKHSREYDHDKVTKIQRFLKKTLLKKYYTLDERIKYFNYVQSYLNGPVKKNLAQHDKCIVPKQFKNSSGFTIGDVIDLEYRIGIRSNYGVVYKTSIKEMLGRFPIATKLMEVDEDNKKEVNLSVAISNNIMKKKISRHFLLCYKSYQCDRPMNNVPDIINRKKYYLALNELAFGDVHSLFNDRQIYSDQRTLLNIVLQCFLSIVTFHKMGYIHQDSHLGNFLYHMTENKTGNYHYNVLGTDYYIENCGYTIMLYDFGLVQKNNGMRPTYYSYYDNEFMNAPVPFIYDYYDYANMMKIFDRIGSRLSVSMQVFIAKCRAAFKQNVFGNEDELIKYICGMFSSSECPFDIMKTTSPDKSQIENAKSYIIDDTLASYLPSTLSSAISPPLLPTPSPATSGLPPRPPKHLQQGTRPLTSLTSLGALKSRAATTGSPSAAFVPALTNRQSRAATTASPPSAFVPALTNRQLRAATTGSPPSAFVPALTNRQLRAATTGSPPSAFVPALTNRPSPLAQSRQSRAATIGSPPSAFKPALTNRPSPLAQSRQSRAATTGLPPRPPKTNRTLHLPQGTHPLTSPTSLTSSRVSRKRQQSKSPEKP